MRVYNPMQKGRRVEGHRCTVCGNQNKFKTEIKKEIDG
jgi:hypothetical protein